jgi:ABC-type sugar transport system ATPase subunit
VQALEDAGFELRPGEVHALVGENGAGKYTLMKVLTGIYSPDAGTIRYKGSLVDIPNPRAGRDLGISMIHQELVLAPHLTVAQNIYRAVSHAAAPASPSTTDARWSRPRSSSNDCTCGSIRRPW